MTRYVTTLVTAPVKFPITRAMVKEHLRISIDDDDDYLDALIGAVTTQVESITGRKLITQTWKYYMSDWPHGDYFELPYGRLQSVTSVKYRDSDNTEYTMSSGEYIVDVSSDPGRVVLDYGETWPSETLLPGNPIYTQFVCGYGDDKEDVPAALRHAMLMLIGHWYEHREAYVSGQFAGQIQEVPAGCMLVLYEYRIHRFGI